jgi:ECF sigma factor
VSRTAALKKVETVAERLANLEAQRDTAVAVAMAAGCTWVEIGAALGVSAQAAHRRFRWLRHSPVTGEVWYAPPLRAK